LKEIISVIAECLNVKLARSSSESEEEQEKRSGLKEKALDLMKAIVGQHIGTIIEMEAGREPVLGKMIESLITHYFDNKEISKKAELVFDEIVNSAQRFNSFLPLLSVKLVEYSQDKQFGAYLPVILKFQIRALHVMSTPQVLQVVDDIFQEQIIANLNHTQAEVRKNIVFCLVELRLAIGQEDFQQYYDRLPSS